MCNEELLKNIQITLPDSIISVRKNFLFLKVGENF